MCYLLKAIKKRFWDPKENVLRFQVETDVLTGKESLHEEKQFLKQAKSELHSQEL